MIGKKPGLGPDNGEATSIIGENSMLDGTFEVTGNLRVDGKFTGKLRVTETLVVGKNGLVDAKVEARNAVVAGTIKGDLNVRDGVDRPPRETREEWLERRRSEMEAAARPSAVSH